MALLVVLLAAALFSAIAAGLVMSSVAARDITSNYDEAGALADAADSVLELAAAELAAIADWDAVLRGAQTSTLTDGVAGARALAGGAAIDLISLTNELTCGNVNPCTDVQVQQYTAERPWGANNPRWRLFAHTPFVALPAAPRQPPHAYVIVWIGDDARETDGNPGADGAGAGQEGRYVVRARVDSFGGRGSRRAIEAELARVCTMIAGVEVCAPGVRVQSWREVSALP